ncbi:hypothetical protein K438DRAFT_1593661 [Mycena galopus ATCC 62051]|nr:hypothetical protein K438DRAFT_1593661 [Mycena galopus ATCC 62051]
MFGQFSARSSANAGPSNQARPPNEPTVKLVQTRLKGNAPIFNDWGSTAVDHKQEKIYMYGGVRPHDEDNIPTNDFNCLDLKTHQWWDLTNSLTFRPRDYVFDPFCKEDNVLQRRPLPALLEPGASVISVGGGTYFLIFGGYDVDNSTPTSELIAVDLELLIWWVVDIQGAPLRARMNASMVAVDNRLFIFGGRDEYAGHGEAPRPASLISTYSIAEYTPRTRWTWRVSDAPLPPDLPLLGYNIQSTPVFKGQKIMLAQGRTSDRPIDLSRESTIFFHTENHTFQDVRTTMGNFPQGISWYKLATLGTGVQLAQQPATPTKRRGRPFKIPRPEPPAVVVPAVPTHDFPDSVVVVAWVKHGEGLVPEAWQYLLPPAERIRCLNLRDKLWDLNLDLQDFVAVGNRLLLLGSSEGREDNIADAEMEVEKPPQRWDVLVEVSTECLKD